jgi:hypothetical protein
MTSVDRFSVGVDDQLGTYVYQLIGPRNCESFHVGRAKEIGSSVMFRPLGASMGLGASSRSYA